MRAIDPVRFRDQIIAPSLRAIGLFSEAAEELVLGTALQESGLQALHQVGGPALGFFQMEPATHDDIWTNFLTGQRELAARLRTLLAGVALPKTAQLVGNAYYAAAMCRVFYVRLDAPLPAAGDLAGQAAYYKRHYNTPAGAATADEYIANWRAAFPETSQGTSP